MKEVHRATGRGPTSLRRPIKEKELREKERVSEPTSFPISRATTTNPTNEIKYKNLRGELKEHSHVRGTGSKTREEEYE